MTETATQRTGLLHLTYQPMSKEMRKDMVGDAESYERHVRDVEMGRLVWQAINDGRAYVVEDLGERDDDSAEGFVRRQRIRTVRITLRDPDTAEIGEWLHSDSIHSDRNPYYGTRFVSGQTDPTSFDETEWHRREGWGWQRVR